MYMYTCIICVLIKPFSGRTPDGCRLRRRREDQIAAAGSGGVARAAAAAHTRQRTYEERVCYGRARAHVTFAYTQSHGSEDAATTTGCACYSQDFVKCTVQAYAHALSRASSIKIRHDSTICTCTFMRIIDKDDRVGHEGCTTSARYNIYVYKCRYVVRPAVPKLFRLAASF